MDQARFWNLVSSRKEPRLFDGRPIYRSTVPGGTRGAFNPLLRGFFRGVVRPPCEVAEVEVCRYFGGPLELYRDGVPIVGVIAERLCEKAEDELYLCRLQAVAIGMPGPRPNI